MIEVLESPTDYQNKLCELFSEYSFESSIDEYKRRKQKNIDKIKIDIYNGKRAEFMVYNWLNKRNNNPSFPDIEIYTGANKSFDADIVANNKNIHVKSCTKSSYESSWVFQPNDNLTKQPLDIDFIFLVEIGEENKLIVISGLKAIELYKPPRLEHLNKKCIYFSDLLAS